MTKHPTRRWLVILACLYPSLSLAQTTPTPAAPPAYLLVVGKATDRAKIGRYAASLPPIYASNSGRYLAVGSAGRGVTWLEGPWQDRSLIVAEFPSRAHVTAFWWGDAYRQAVRLRDDAGVFSVVALEGRAPTMSAAPKGALLIVMTARRNASSNQQQLSSQAALSLERGIVATGGIMLTTNDISQIMTLEGDTVFDRFLVAAWETTAARDAYLASREARVASQLRARLGLSAVATANGVPQAAAIK